MWSAIHKFAIMILNFVSSIVLARLLTPHDYGIIGMLTIFLAVSTTFIDGGFGSALIQKKRPTNEDYSTILFWNIGLSVFLYCILFVCSPLIARFYELPLLTDVLRAQSLVLIINAFRIVQRNQLRKKLQFKKIAIINCSSNFASLFLTIILAYKGFGVWALVFQQLSLSFLTTLLYWITSNWKPKFAFSWKSFKELFGFGSFILLSNLFNTLCNNIQGLLIGKVYNASSLGFYTKARRTELLSSTFISSVLDQVAYPVLSESQNNQARMVGILKKFICTSAYLTFPLMLLLILLARPIFILLYSERWEQSIPYFQILCLAGIAISLQSINSHAVAAVGKSKEILKWTIVKRLLGLCCVVGGLILYGMYGLLAGMVLTSWIVYLINANIASKFVGYKLKQQMKDLLPILLLSIFSFLSAYSIEFLNMDNIYVNGAFRFVIFLMTYVLSSMLFSMEAYSFTKETFLLLVSNFKKSANKRCK